MKKRLKGAIIDAIVLAAGVSIDSLMKKRLKASNRATSAPFPLPVSIDSLMKKRLKAAESSIPVPGATYVSIDSLMKKRLKGRTPARRCGSYWVSIDSLMKKRLKVCVSLSTKSLSLVCFN